MNNEMNRFNVVCKIGEGQFSKVYKIEQNVNGKIEEYALKYIDYSTIKSNPEAINNLKNELNIIRIVNNNKNIISYYNYGDNVNEGSIFIIMELLTSIKDYYQEKSITQDEVVKIGKDICSALKVFHTNKLIHSDVKPSNIFVTKDGEYKLGDFNITVNGNDSSYYGTPSFMSPEAFKGEKSQYSDIYSLGLVLFSLLNKGKLPFENDRNNVYKAIEIRNSGKKIPRIMGIDKKLMNIILKALEFNKDDRFCDVDEMYKQLECVDLGKKRFFRKKIKFLNLDQTLDVNNPIVSNMVYTNFENIRDKYTFKSLIKIFSVVLFSVILFCSLITAYLLNRGCKSGFVNRNGFCVKGYYSCEEGYEVRNNKCVKVIERVAARENSYCPDGYFLSEGYCVNKNTLSPTFSYICADGFTLNGTSCVKEESAEAALIYYCPDNYVLAGTKCVTANSRDATVSYSCPNSSYTKNGTKCTKMEQVTTDAVVTYGCSNGGTLSGTKCHITSSPVNSGYGGWWWPVCDQGTYSSSDQKCHYIYDASKTYTCTSGTSNGAGKCTKNSSVSIDATPKYTCPSGYITVGDKCTTSETINATPKYTCTTDTVLKGNMCYGTISIQAVGLYNCQDGYVLSGTTCIKDDFKKPEVKYTCSRLYTLKEKNCEKYEIINAIANYEGEVNENEK